MFRIDPELSPNRVSARVVYAGRDWGCDQVAPPSHHEAAARQPRDDRFSLRKHVWRNLKGAANAGAAGAIELTIDSVVVSPDHDEAAILESRYVRPSGCCELHL